MLKVLVRNIVSNWIGFAVQVAVVFFLTPFVLHSLGDARYGIWALVTGLNEHLPLGSTFATGKRRRMTVFFRLSTTRVESLLARCRAGLTGHCSPWRYTADLLVEN
jgi:hypothetical protein